MNKLPRISTRKWISSSTAALSFIGFKVNMTEWDSFYLLDKISTMSQCTDKYSKKKSLMYQTREISGLEVFIRNKTICPVKTAMYKIRFKDIILKLNKSRTKISKKKTINKKNSTLDVLKLTRKQEIKLFFSLSCDRSRENNQLIINFEDKMTLKTTKFPFFY